MKASRTGSVIRSIIALMVSLMVVFAFGAGQALAKETLVISDLGWDSAQVHNRIAGFIIENGYGYGIEYIPGDTIPMFAGLERGDIDITMEIWVDNQQPAYDNAIAAGKVVDLGANFPDSWQGWLVPTYVIKGDPARGIKPMAPDLKSVSDLPKYAKLFKDVEDPGKGRFYSCIAGWECEKINEKKFAAYGLNDTYNIFLPGSGAALVASLVGSYKKGEPWFGYYWAPTWVLGLYDMTPLEEPAYDKAVFESTAKSAYPAVSVNIAVHSSMPKKAPEVVEFLKKYETTQAIANKFLAFMQEKEADTQQAAEWFLKEYEDLWTGWVSGDVAAKVKKALK
ncbi:ABC transporter substrate-binding protein [bacterium]|nr:ABC transporter substrate-binding protein [bacterium]